MDLHLVWDGRNAKEMALQAQRFGYRCVAFDCKVTPAQARLLQPFGVSIPGIRALRRITVTVNNDPVDFSEISRCWDILCVHPLTEDAWKKCCSGQLQCDVITLNLGEKLPFRILRADVDQFVKRNGFFELVFNQALRDQTARRYVFQNSQEFIRITRGKNIILTSGATNVMEMRSPEDLRNFAQVLGMRGMNGEELVRKIDG
eukprot:GEMP01097951.1.p1 GENE.GEMP01097951.1~~GEMP01097951.1.p1  ORF type:complete len:203 (+),score=35.55 GEMP01097951.1:23-631(+)